MASVSNDDSHAHPRTLASATVLQIVPALREEPVARAALNVASALVQSGARALVAAEDGPQLVGNAVRIAVEHRLKVTPVDPVRVSGQLAFQFGTSLTGSLAAGGLRADDEYACGK